MKRVRQESSESYEVTLTEIALALGIWSARGDAAELTHMYGDNFRLTVRTTTIESVELEAPVYDPVREAIATHLLEDTLEPYGVVQFVLPIPPPAIDFGDDEAVAALEADAEGTGPTPLLDALLAGGVPELPITFD